MFTARVAGTTTRTTGSPKLPAPKKMAHANLLLGAYDGPAAYDLWTHRNISTLQQARSLCTSAISSMASEGPTGQGVALQAGNPDKLRGSGPAGGDPTSPATSCSDLLLHRKPNPALTALRLLVGIHSSPTGFVRREAIRATWKRYPSVAHGATVLCFVIGRPPNASLGEALAHEARDHGDMLLLDVAEHGKLSIAKALAYWRRAATIVDRHHSSPGRGGYPFVAKCAPCPN
jgi:hypothetical protein